MRFLHLPAYLFCFFLTLPLAGQERLADLPTEALVGTEGNLWIADSDGWRIDHTGLPTRRVYPFEEERGPRITSVTHSGSEEFLLTTGRSLFRGRPGTWEEVASREEFGTYAYFTAVAGTTEDPSLLALGTSFHGLFLSRDRGRNWTDLSGLFPSLLRGAGYVEEISSLAFDSSGSRLFILANHGRELYSLDLSGGAAVRRPLPEGVSEATRLFGGTKGPMLLEAEREGASTPLLFSRAPSGWRVERTAAEPWASRRVSSPEEERRRALAADKAGFYVPFLQAEGEELEEHIAFAKRNGLNAVVIDFKDDWGRVTYDSDLPETGETGARRAYFRLEPLVERLDEAGIYLIARVVVFKDRQLHSFDGGRYAIRDRDSGAPWGEIVVQRNEAGEVTGRTLQEHWVDPYSREVWEYNVAIGEELARRGVDEIQFDYIRFPSDGPVGRASFTYQREGMGKEEALESFLTLARERIDIPIGVDVFGFNGYYEMDYLGQNIALISRHVDVISPMLYPSHFARDFLGELSYLPRAREIYRSGTRRARAITEDRALIRPYVQAFLLGGELAMEEPEYKGYLREQLRGSVEGGAGGTLLWNFSGRYYMVE